MSTRLDRLFLLLDTGSTPLIRKSAAEQLGDVVRLHPHELNTLLVKIHSFLRSLTWETRVAAAQAIDAIAKNVPQWEPRGAPKSECDMANFIGEGTVLFSHFDIKRVLECGSSLLGSEGDQYDIGTSLVDMDDRDQLSQQRQQLNKRLGLDITGQLGIDSSNLFNDDDLRMNVEATLPSMNNNSQPVVELLKQQLGARSQMSSRERNVAKRKARSLSKHISSNNNANDEPCPVKRIKRERSTGSLDSTDSSQIEEPEDWPFQNFCEVLINDLFHSSWEVRHGAASGLREVIKTHGRGAGKTMDIPSNQLASVNQVWLSDLALRLLCVLALDRFGDFVSDEVVAPVRETCAQALGTVLKYMEESSVSGVVSIALQMLEQVHWEVRHGALLSLKYILAVRQDLTSKLLPLILPAILKGLLDPDDDVRAVAAAALIPVTDPLVTCLPEQLPVILSCLWDILADLDDLTASTNSIMTLLAKLMSHTDTKSSSFMTSSLTDLTPRLWPFFRHSIVSVRKAALETFYTLLTMKIGEMTCQWLIPIYQDAIRHIYQRSILEEKSELLPLIVKVWTSLLECANMDYLYALAVPWLGVWLAFLMQPPRLAYDPSLLIEAKHKPRENRKSHTEMRHIVQDVKNFIGGLDTLAGNSAEKDATINRARVCGSRLFSMLASKLCLPTLVVPVGQETPLDVLSKLFMFHLNGKSAVQRFVIGQVIYLWATYSTPCPCSTEVVSQLLVCLGELIYFDEIAISFTRMQNDCQDFLASLKQQGINLDTTYPPRQLLTLEAALTLTSTTYKPLRSLLKPQMLSKFDERQKQLHSMVTLTSQEQQTYSIRVLCSLSMAVVALNALPEKLNPVVRPLMDVIKKEENESLQEEAAMCLTQLIKVCIARNPSPNSKIITNLCGFLCSDPTYTPNISNPMSALSSTHLVSEVSNLEVPCTMFRGILTLSNLQKVTESNFRKRRGRIANIFKSELDTANIDGEISMERKEQMELQKQLLTQRQGAEAALTLLCKMFSATLPEQLPSLWNVCVESFKLLENALKTSSSSKEEEIHHLQEFVNNLQTMETVIPALNSDLLPFLMDQLDTMCSYLSHEMTAVRHMVSRVFAALSVRNTLKTMYFVIHHILPLLGATDDENKREGGTEAIANILESLGIDSLPYIVLLVIPILGRMSDQMQSIRLMATHCFATLVRLMPLEAGIPDTPTTEAWLIERRERERSFLDQLFDMTKKEDYKILVPVNAELRKYQQDGVNWLGFLNKYKLHGILCDDMGLGKTLQSICVMATDHLERENKYKKSQDPDCSPLPSIVVCPPTLVGHWVYEVNKFVDPIYLNPLMYVGPPAERNRLQKLVTKHNLIVASYDVVRNDIDFFSGLRWNYCILDEGHIIRNGKTKLAKATKQLICNHRLILSGTPIQNNVLDLWSLFDFLMPGFLGTEKQFQVRYGRPILQSREGKSTSKEQEAGALAMEALHRQVLPFILRRLKEDVLQDLPPKIMQDYFCDLSPLQVELYEDFAKSRAKRSVDETVVGGEDMKDKKVSNQGTTHIFQALQYLRKLCNHPALVLNSTHPKYKETMAGLQQQGTNLHDLSHAPKLTALKQLLYDCGIGLNNCSTASGSTNQMGVDSVPVVNQHRVLLFCQLKSMLDIVEKDLLKSHMPSVTFLRLDGTVPAGSRHDIVHRFNNDPSIDLLLLTTHVGGLGLNLTGADTVIFVEHDWNPMKDLQAMDRAHRIGQKKVVNVYRLITRGTLEEKIMGLQKFKMAVANTVITQENSSVQTMGTEQLLDLFILDQNKKGNTGSSVSDQDKKPKKETVKNILEGLEELWDESQYENEYNMDSFMKSLST
ncbi:TATA-binding protein-associated factor 172-like [Biomphalaria glabrata]|uniref:TATA-binding protein-associated factor 172-like n=1 Tax=Biomphalaria glabrata TaxID=6526 RepID=A0A2C9JFS0_BIOGL|nr:TATA-binding protein-associated factor 172-like [Biomphalaria glabrata]KAI8765032.1 TATA-binding protein-associated factor 172-like [Biomphalaria glabrata]